MSPLISAMADSVSIDPTNFCKRLKKLFDHWKVGQGLVPILRNNWTSGCDGFKNPFYSSLQANQTSTWSDASAIAIVVGASSEDLRYLKSISIQLWLFGYELPGPSDAPIAMSQHARFHGLIFLADTAMVFTKSELHILTSQKKGNYIEKGPFAMQCPRGCR